MKNYKTYFEKYYNIKISKNYEIHHIDLNHNNNDINNLMLLPKKLHQEYHRLLNEYSRYKTREIKFLISGNMVGIESYFINLLNELTDIIKECNKWYDYKKYLDGQIPNIHDLKIGE